MFLRGKKCGAFHRLALLVLLFFPLPSFAGIAVVVGANCPITSLSKSKISDVFLGKTNSLAGGIPAVPIDQPESSPLRDKFYSEVTNKSAAQAKAHWAKLYFTGRGEPPLEAENSSNIKSILNATPGAIGYIDQSALDSSVKVIFVVQ